MPQQLVRLDMKLSKQNMGLSYPQSHGKTCLQCQPLFASVK